MLKIGDELICKNTNGLSFITLNKSYKINSIHNGYIIIHDDYDDHTDPMYFTLDNNKNYSYLFDYFYTPLEIRNKKLETI